LIGYFNPLVLQVVGEVIFDLILLRKILVRPFL